MWGILSLVQWRREGVLDQAVHVLWKKEKIEGLMSQEKEMSQVTAHCGVAKTPEPNDTLELSPTTNTIAPPLAHSEYLST